MGYIPVCTGLDKVNEIQNTFFFYLQQAKMQQVYMNSSMF